jgi:hypothetical protein
MYSLSSPPVDAFPTRSKPLAIVQARGEPTRIEASIQGKATIAHRTQTSQIPSSSTRAIATSQKKNPPKRVMDSYNAQSNRIAVRLKQVYLLSFLLWLR